MIYINKIKLHQLKSRQKCRFGAYLDQFDFKSINNKALMIRKVYKDILKEINVFNSTLNKNELQQLVLDKLDDKFFLTSQEKDVEVNIIVNHLKLYLDYERKFNKVIIAKDVYCDIEINNTLINVHADIIVNNNGVLEVIKYETGAPILSYKARTEKNKPHNNIELFLLKKLGEKLYGDKYDRVISSFYHLKGKNEDKNTYNEWLTPNGDRRLISHLSQLESMKSSTVDKKELKSTNKQIKQIKDVLYFDNTEGKNIITFDYDNDLTESIVGLLNVDLTYQSEKCESNDCNFCNHYTLCHHKNDNIKFEEVKEVKKSSGKVKLTDAQKEIVDIEEGNYRVNAVPGSGKSTVMVLRVIELLKKGYQLEDILMITFTNKGCQELKEKIIYWMKQNNMYIPYDKFNIFTFNSFGEYIISQEWKVLGFDKQPDLSTLIDTYDIIKELLEKHSNIEWLNYKNPLINYPNSKGAFIQLLNYFNVIKSFNYDVSELIENVLSKEKDCGSMENMKQKAFTLFELYDEFDTVLKNKSLLQYQDQILYSISLLENWLELVKKYGYQHVVVDEYQDTDFTQVNLLHLLKSYKNNKSLIVVGDADQSIYKWRNTTPENIINFHKEFDNVKDIFMIENFRSTPQICNVANKLIKLNKQRIDKDIVSRKVDGKIPQLLHSITLEDEYKNIVNLIQEKINEGIQLHELSFIARTKKELLDLQVLLKENNIPCVVEASELFLDNSKVQLILNLANFFKNPDNVYPIMELLAISDPNFYILNSTEDIDFMVNKFKDMNMEIFSKLETEEDKINFFINMINTIAFDDEITEAFIKNLNVEQFHTFNELLNHLYKYKLYNDNTAIEKTDRKYEGVALTTGHSSKGKEWSVVIDSINKYKYEDIQSDIDLLEEERRLLFVSITRAKDELYITYNTNENKSRGKGKYCLFADELDGVERVDV